MITPITIQKWKNEMSNYNKPTKKDIPEVEYLNQEIEIDAIAFAHYHMDELFKVKTIIPTQVKQSVLRKVKCLN